MKGYIYVLLLCLFCGKVVAQSPPILGSDKVAAGSTSGYYVLAQNVQSWNLDFHPGPTGTSIITISNSASCTVQWGNYNGWARLSCVLYGGNSYSLFILVGVPSITPSTINIYYNSTPPPLTVSFLAGASNSIQWEQSLDNGFTYTPLGVTTNTYQPPSLISPVSYRCIVVIDGITYTSYPAVVYVTLYSLTPGVISLKNNPCNFNVTPLIESTPAQYSICSTYLYAWEMSIENGDWQTIGTSENYPVNAIPKLVSNVRLRRSVTCAGETKYSNILDINPTYISANYEPLNYVRTNDILVPGIQSWIQADELSADKKIQTTDYLDGLGRKIQTNVKQASGKESEWKDIVTHYDYTASEINGFWGRSFIPFIAENGNGIFLEDAEHKQSSFVRTFFNEPNTAPTYATTLTDNSPLNRPVKSLNPGQAWGGNNIGVSSIMDFNTASDEVRVWEFQIPYSSNSIPFTNTVYEGGTLNKTIVVDEKQKKVITFTDFSGNVILKKVEADLGNWALTYYVYDDLGQLRYTLPPKAVDHLLLNGWTELSKISDDLCFTKEFDKRGRIIIKKQPGQLQFDASHIVYDSRNRVVATQDGLQRTQGIWGFALYDGLNRQVATGNFTSSDSRIDIQDAINLQYINNEFSEIDCSLAFDASLTDWIGFKATMPIIVDDNNSVPIPNVTINNAYFNSLNTFGNYNASVKTINIFGGYSFVANPSPNSEPENHERSNRVSGILTNQLTRVLDANASISTRNFLRSTFYYDEKARNIQTLSENIKKGIDVASSQYDFMSKVVCSHLRHEIKTGSPSSSKFFETISLPEYDKLGRTLSISRKYGTNIQFKKIANYAYDAYGQLANKVLDPAYFNATRISGGIESFDYKYNINGWLTYINKDYVNSANNSTQWQHYFGLQLGYENSGNVFSAAQYNGQLTGVKWRSQGNNTPTKFDYEYDNLGRLTAAKYTQKDAPSATSWSNAKANYSTLISYADVNGNIATMKHFGMLPGAGTGPNNASLIDDLDYTYLPASNKLMQVTDNANIGAVNGKLGDFRLGGSTPGNDGYAYDVNGNVTMDLYKNANIIEYDLILNKPRKMSLANGDVEYTYDASGGKLAKTVTSTGNTTYYIGSFVYQNDDLEYITHEEGRIKIMKNIGGNGANIVDFNTAGTFSLEAGKTNEYIDINSFMPNKTGCFDFFVKDQLGNTRMVLTEEIHKEKYKANFEPVSPLTSATQGDEAEYYGQLDPATSAIVGVQQDINANAPRYDKNEYKLTLYQLPNTVWQTNPTRGVAKLTAQADINTGLVKRKIGPNQLLKVMAGDKISSNVDYFYQANNNNYTGSGHASNIINNIIFSIIGASTTANIGDIVKGQTTEIANTLTNNNSFQGLLDDKDGNTGTTKPFAHLNVVFFDEQFNFVAPDPTNIGTGTRFERVKTPNIGDALSINTKAPKNGYVYIYLSNESDEPVYFDNFYNTIERGRITQETHYYPFGQKIAGLSSAVANKLKNNYNYQGDFCEEETETGYDEFDLRFYDPTIGRWLANDPYDEFGSPYVGMGNDPVNNVDPSGGDIWGAILGTMGGAAIGNWAHNQWGNDDNKGGRSNAILLGAFLGSGIGYSLEETCLSNGYNNNGNFWGNFAAFYVGLVPGLDNTQMGFGADKFGHYASSPSVWGDVKLFEWVEESSKFVLSNSINLAQDVNSSKTTSSEKTVYDKNDKPAKVRDTRSTIDIPAPPKEGYNEIDDTRIDANDGDNFVDRKGIPNTLFVYSASINGRSINFGATRLPNTLKRAQINLTSNVPNGYKFETIDLIKKDQIVTPNARTIKLNQYQKVVKRRLKFLGGNTGITQNKKIE